MPINILSSFDMNDAVNGWRLSRNADMQYRLKELAGVDAPVLELPTALFHFENFTILEREIFTSSRSHVIWARTSRVDNPLEFTVPEPLRRKVHEDLRHMMATEFKAGTSQDTWRMHLPLVAHTTWIARMSYRELIKMYLYFRYLETKLKDHTLRVRFLHVCEMLHQTVTTMVAPHIVTSTMMALQPDLLLCERQQWLDPGLITIGDWQVLVCNIPIALRAQVVRHRGLQISDSFYQILCSEDVCNWTLNALVHAQIAAPKSYWRSILGKRSCWIAQADLWQQIIKNFGPAVLPCSDGICKYVTDATARLTKGNDPQPPCPHYMNLHNLDKKVWHAAMAKEAQKRGQFWIDEVNR